MTYVYIYIYIYTIKGLSYKPYRPLCAVDIEEHGGEPLVHRASSQQHLNGGHTPSRAWEQSQIKVKGLETKSNQGR